MKIQVNKQTNNKNTMQMENRRDENTNKQTNKQQKILCKWKTEGMKIQTNKHTNKQQKYYANGKQKR